MKAGRRIRFALVAVVLGLAGCSSDATPSTEPTAGKKADPFDFNSRPYYYGKKPFKDRVDIRTADADLRAALGRVRGRIDAEFGKQDWTWIKEPVNVFYGCADGKNEGGEYNNAQGKTYGIPMDKFSRIHKIFKEEVEPLGFTTAVDISDKGDKSFDYYNEGDGGYINMGMTREEVFGMWYTTGCRPAPAGSTPDPDGRLDTPTPSESATASP